MKKVIRICCGALLSLSLLACGQKAQKSEVKIIDESLLELDLLAAGPFEFDDFDYALPAFTDPEISPLLAGDGTLPIDLRGRLYLPRSSKAVPLVVFLAGNHSTCGRSLGMAGDPRFDYEDDLTFEGRCPEGSGEVPSHLGYEESARHLASHGFAVISINANRGINGNFGRRGVDDYLVYVRGLLVLKHLEALQKWSRLAQVPSVESPLDLRGRLDWSEIGLMGHSRGGEGVRFAYNIWSNSAEGESWKARLPGLSIQSIFEVAPIDQGLFIEQRIERVAAKGADWAVLIPACDSDVSDFEGISPFLRMLKEDDGYSKAVFTVWGANHNFFNSEWHISDAPHVCKGEQVPLWDTSGEDLPFGDPKAKAGLRGSNVQRQMLRALLLSFFKAHLGKDRSAPAAHIFDPQFRLPRQLAELAPSQREFFPADGGLALFHGSFKPTPTEISEGLAPIGILDYLPKIAKALAKERLKSDDLGFTDIVPHFNEGNIVRAAWVFDSSEQPSEEYAMLPFSAQPLAAGYWTLDLALLLDGNCPAHSCSSQISQFTVSLVYADGSSSLPLALSAYGDLKPLQGPLVREGREWTDLSGDILHLGYVSNTPLFQTVRIELRDFQVPSNKALAGLKFFLPAGSTSTLLIESARLSKKPGSTSAPWPL